MEEYQSQLRHVAEPAAPSGRDQAVSANISSFEALWLSEQLKEYAHYGDHPEDSHAGIAIAYVEFIDKKVRDEERNYVTLYAHTEAAADTLMGAMFNAEHGGHQSMDGDASHRRPDDKTDAVLKEAVSSPLADIYVEHADGEPARPRAVEEHDTVEFEEGAAGEAIAEAEMARAESEALAKQERRAERADGRI